MVTSKAVPKHPVYAADDSLAARWRKGKAVGSIWILLAISSPLSFKTHSRTRCSSLLDCRGCCNMGSKSNGHDERDAVGKHFEEKIKESSMFNWEGISTSESRTQFWFILIESKMEILAFYILFYCLSDSRAHMPAIERIVVLISLSRYFAGATGVKGNRYTRIKQFDEINFRRYLQPRVSPRFSKAGKPGYAQSLNGKIERPQQAEEVEMTSRVIACISCSSRAILISGPYWHIEIDWVESLDMRRRCTRVWTWYWRASKAPVLMQLMEDLIFSPYSDLSHFPVQWQRMRLKNLNREIRGGGWIGPSPPVSGTDL